MSEEIENVFNENNVGNTKSDIKRKKHQCPHCKEILSYTYLEQHPFNEVPCSSCGSLIDVSSIEDVAVPALDERSDTRCEVSIKVSYKSVDSFITEYTKNVSMGGMFIKTKTQHEIGSCVELLLHVSGLEEPLKITGQVIHRKFFNVKDEDAGIGVKFVDIDDSSRDAFINFLKSQEG